MQLVEAQEEAVLTVIQGAARDEVVGLGEQRALVLRVPPHDRELGVLPVAGEGAHPRDHLGRLTRLLLAVRQRTQPAQHLIRLGLRLGAARREPPRALAGREVADVAQDQRDDRGWLLRPARAGDVDLADAPAP